MKALTISFVTHVIVIGAALIGSLVAPQTMPRLLKRISPPIIAEMAAPRDVPLSPERQTRVGAKALAAAAAPVRDIATAAPLVAPSGIAPESGRESIGAPGAVLGVADGLAGVTLLETIAAPPPPPDSPKRPLLLHSGITAPRKVVDVPPNYPEIARNARIDGLVIIEATIDEHGNVIEARVLKSVSLLDAPALAAVRQWKFTPARLNGEPVPVVMTVTVNFQLR
jgi:periplasmic protein TonB